MSDLQHLQIVGCRLKEKKHCSQEPLEFLGTAYSVFHNCLTILLKECLSTRVEPVQLLSALIQEHSGEDFKIENDSFLKESVSIPIWRMHANVQCRISNSEKC